MYETGIVEVAEKDVSIVRRLFVEYRQWLGVDLCFQGFEQELASLPGDYAPPRGVIFLAVDEGDAIGCVAIRPRTGQEAELKRLYVRPVKRGRGLGRRLFEAAMARTQQIGYASIVLDTLPGMHTAKALYRARGFETISPYYENPEPGAEYYRYRFDDS